MRLSRPDLETLIHAATLAPSPDNNQPWLFEERPEGELLLLHDRSRALPSDVDDMFSMLALGAALENLCLAAGQRGWQAWIEHPQTFNADSQGREVIAVIRFAQGGTADPLAEYLDRRVTCRKPYSRHAVDVELLRQIEISIAASAGPHLHWCSDRSRIRTLARLVAGADRIRFEYQPFHAELYRQLRFSPQEAQIMCDGLDVRCLELPLGASALLRWLRKWSRMRILNRVGLSRLLSVASAVQVWRTGTIGFLTTSDMSKRGFLQAGRVLQRIWLKATQLGLAFHPLGSIPIFLARVTRGEGSGLTVSHQEKIRHLRRKLDVLLPDLRQEDLVLLFRLGKAVGSPVRSLRRAVANVLISDTK